AKLIAKVQRCRAQSRLRLDDDEVVASRGTLRNRYAPSEVLHLDWCCFKEIRGSVAGLPFIISAPTKSCSVCLERQNDRTTGGDGDPSAAAAQSAYRHGLICGCVGPGPDTELPC